MGTIHETDESEEEIPGLK